MTKPGTMRWKVVWSNTPLSARYLNDPPVLGARLASSVIWKSPQLVLTVATYVCPGESCVLGLGSLTVLGAGLETDWQPLAVCDVVAAGVAGPPLLAAGAPPPAGAHHNRGGKEAGRGRGQGGGGKAG